MPPPTPPNDPPVAPLEDPLIEPLLERTRRKPPDKPDEPSMKPDKPPTEKAPVIDKGPLVKVKWDEETAGALAFLKQQCVSKVPCAANVVEWSRRTKSDLDRQQVAEAASTCARTCRLK